ncbi:uncharacterized protein HMPREF1541_01356 [Cyphellophora europaea CBS 101466]|uniref:Uncharacterized protein n=1 Tax=Cyphellophora europaea (strain CBS 101466) TaxID=1220924 RepID=W2SEV4_CYPE1|nr:uncharacterized protein HMPREF1541_01356 [Cyphellophora europaea CBS 101466]ETN47165.1 hypothetical protein HMPREF1541_01356 [Cyphellophora europaea CBS 101466]
MSKKSKRNADEAFEQAASINTSAGEIAGSEHATKRQKKHKSKKHRRESSGIDDAAAQLLREEKQSSSQDVPQEASQPCGADKTNSKRKRKSAHRDSLAAKSPSVDAREVSSAVEAGRSPVNTKYDVDSGTGQQSTKVSVNKRKRENKRHRAEAADEDKSATHTQQTEEEAASRLSRSEKKRERKRLKALSKKSEEQRAVVPLEARIQDPDDVASEDIKQQSEDESKISEDGGVMLDETMPLADRIQAPRRTKRKMKSKSKISQIFSDNWSLSDAAAGSFSDQDPIMTDDDQYLILPTVSEVRIYSTSTSLLVRSLRTHGTIVGCVISKSDPSKILAARSDGNLSVWDWTTGRKHREWRSPRGLRALVSMSAKGPGGSELVLALHGDDSEDRQLAVYALVEGTEAVLLQTLLTRKRLNAEVQLYEQAGFVVVSAYSRLIIGVSTGLQSPDYEQSAVTWREFAMPSNIESLDARVYETEGKSSRKRLDVVVGLKNGSIVLYEDVLYKMIAREKKKQDDEIAARYLNWHRTAVNTVKWSRDGDYVISGGNETVLVIWQLDTNKQQFLPHLSTEIKRLSVSRKGSSYVLYLNDNSVMVLSTADLQPMANVSLLAAQRSGSLAAVMHSTKPGHLLTAVPRSVTASHAGEATSLQTYDIQSDIQIARQALTRNLTTTINVGPDGSFIKEPNVGHVALSYDGAWFASVEEWSPPSSSLEVTYLIGDSARQERTEITLKFWSSSSPSENDSEWALTSRVDSPHHKSRVLALASSPLRAEFSTLASDGTVQVWIPRPRRRDGVLVRGVNGQTLYNWSVSRQVPLNPSSTVSAGALAYSEDGSVLAASLSTSSHSTQWTSLIPLTGTSSSSRIDPASISHTPSLHPPFASFLYSAFTGPQLVTLSPSFLSVHDTINSLTMTPTPLGGDFTLATAGTTRRITHHLAANPLDGTIAIALNPAHAFLPGSRVLVLSLRGGAQDLPTNAEDDTQTEKKAAGSPVIFEALLHGQTRALLPRAGAPGYVVVDSNAEVRQIRGPGSAATRAFRPFTTTAAGAGLAHGGELQRGLDAIFGKASAATTTTGAAARAEDRGQRDAAPAPAAELEGTGTGAGTRRVEDVLGWQTSVAVPSVREVFERVVGLFRKPQQV